MGQAKNRGSFETRQAQAVVAKQQRIAAYERHKLEVERNMSPEERAAQKRTRQTVNTLLAIAAGSMLS